MQLTAIQPNSYRTNPNLTFGRRWLWLSTARPETNPSASQSVSRRDLLQRGLVATAWALFLPSSLLAQQSVKTLDDLAKLTPQALSAFPKEQSHVTSAHFTRLPASLDNPLDGYEIEQRFVLKPEPFFQDFELIVKTTLLPFVPEDEKSPESKAKAVRVFHREIGITPGMSDEARKTKILDYYQAHRLPELQAAVQAALKNMQNFQPKMVFSNKKAQEVFDYISDARQTFQTAVNEALKAKPELSQDKKRPYVIAVFGSPQPDNDEKGLMTKTFIASTLLFPVYFNTRAGILPAWKGSPEYNQGFQDLKKQGVIRDETPIPGFSYP